MSRFQSTLNRGLKFSQRRGWAKATWSEFSNYLQEQYSESWVPVSIVK